MTSLLENTKKNISELENIIAQAMSKAKVQKETQLCSYIPWEAGHLHHLRFLKLKDKNPDGLLKMIKKHILDQDALTALPSLTRSKSYLRKKRVHAFKFSRSQIDRLIEVCEKAGADYADLVELFHGSLQEEISLDQVTKLMKKMLKDKKMDKKLLATYEKLLQG